MLPLDFLSGITDFVALQLGNFAPIIYLVVGILGFLYITEVIIGSLRDLIEKRQPKEPSGFQKTTSKIEERIGRKLTKKERRLYQRASVLEEQFKGVMKGKGVSSSTK